MMNKRHVKGKGSTALAIVLCVCFGLAIELVAGAFVSIGVGRGVLSEDGISLAAHILRIFGTVSATVLSWIIEREKKILSAGITAAVVTLVPVVAAMLFWSIDGGTFAVGLAISALSSLLCVWGMSRIGSKRNISRYKKHYC